MIRQFELVDMVKAYEPDIDEMRLNRAYVFSMKAHGLQKRASGDPYFSHVLPSLNLSPLAQEIMSDLNDLFVESFELRSKTSKVIEKGKEIDIHLNAWDAGIYQHKKMWYTEPTLKAKWESLRVKHQQLAKSLEHGVYTFGFLK